MGVNYEPVWIRVQIRVLLVIRVPDPKTRIIAQAENPNYA